MGQYKFSVIQFNDLKHKQKCVDSKLYFVFQQNICVLLSLAVKIRVGISSLYKF